MNWRALVAAGVFVVLLIAAVLIARPDGPREDETPKPARKSAPPVVAAPSPPLARADLIDAAARAADAQARGLPAPAGDGELAGRRFTLRLPFGCTGSAAADSQAPMRWSYDETQGTLRVSVTPNVWTDAEPVRAAAAGVDYEAAEGFWIKWPWLRSGDCPLPPPPAPAAEPAAEPAADAAQGNQAVSAAGPAEAAADAPAAEAPAAELRETLALVELFKPGSRRAARRNGKPYTVVAPLAPNEIDLARGLRVAVTGRIARFGAGATIVCRSEDVDRRPLCLVAVEIDRVAITDATGQRVFGEWGP
ncbi:MAG TPA: hypothetical protein VEZ70_03380 [Allosphingosinicella sp.]|nr:hypothetical protein [Allosphingosinicella sp.]